MDKVNSDLIRGNIDTIILRCLHIGDMYGLEICNLIKEASGGTYILKQPTLYSALARLEKQKVITSYWRDSAIGGRRHYYKLTEEGRISFENKKDGWQGARQVIDTLVEGIKKPTETTEIKPAQEITSQSTPPPNAIISPVTLFTSISPYNPYAESDEYVTLPVASKVPPINTKNADSSRCLYSDLSDDNRDDQSNYSHFDNTNTNISYNNNPPQIRPYIFNNEYQSNRMDTIDTNEYEQPKKVEIIHKPSSQFNRYLSPDDHSTLAAKQSKLNLAAKASPKISNYNIEIKPFIKHYGDKKSGDFVMVNRMKFVCALLVSCLIIACLTIAQIKLKTEYTSDERAFFFVAYSITIGYFIYHIIRFISGYKSKRRTTVRPGDLIARICIAVLFAVVVLSINILTGLTFINSAEYLVFWCVPCVLACGIVLEGLVQVLLKKSKLFAA